MNIFLVDDDPGILRSLKKVLENVGHSCSIYSDPIKAANAILSNQIDLIISDLVMNQFSGVDMVNVVKKLKPEIPIILMSGYENGESLIEKNKLDVYGFFIKPLDLPGLINTLKEIENERYSNGLINNLT